MHEWYQVDFVGGGYEIRCTCGFVAYTPYHMDIHEREINQ